jgi:gliding motility-associated-like protein
LIFKAGENRLAVAATDLSGNSDTCKFKVIITGNVKPTIATADCGVGNITVKADSCSAPVSYNVPTVTYSPCSPKDVESYNFASGTKFSIGNHIVIYTAKDKIGNSATCSFTVTIEDKDAPKIEFKNLTKKDTVVITTSNCSAKVIWDEPITKDVPCDTSKVILIPDLKWKSGDTFPVGITTLTYKANDNSNNSSEKLLYIQVLDNQAPVFTKCPKNVEVSVDGTIISDPDSVLDNTKIVLSPKCDSISLAYKNQVFAAKDNCDTSLISFVFPKNNLPIKTNNYAIGSTPIKVIAKDKSGNESTTCDFNIVVKPFSLKPKAVVSDSFPCVGDAITLRTDSIAGVKAVWSASNGFSSVFSINSLKNVTASQSGKYFVYYQKGNCKSEKDSVALNVIAPPVVKDDTLKLKAGTLSSGSITGNDTLQSGVKYKVTWQTPTVDYGTFTGKETGEFSYDARKGTQGWVPVRYDLCYEDCPDACVKNKILWIEVTKDVPIDCRVQNLLTPNGDSFNDKLEIDCIGTKTGAKIYIYSQWGELVYSSEDYKNDWEGTWKGKPLPDGTYFYVFQLNATRDPQKGYIVIFR